jgi:predicted membrane protein
VQSAQQRDLAALALVVGLFIVLFVVTLVVGPTAQ